MGKTEQIQQETSQGSAADVEHIQTLGQEVLGAMQTIRELLDARATALETCRTALLAHSGQLVKDREELARQETELCQHFESREQALQAREAECERSERTQTERVATNEAQLQQVRAEHEQAIQALTAAQKDLERRESALSRQHQQMQEQQAALDEQASALQQAQADLAARAAETQAAEQDLDRQRTQIERIRGDWQAQMQEVSAARDSLAELRRQLEAELTRAASQKQDILEAVSQPQGKGTVSSALPGEVEQNLRQSAERFQKLCRDAKRKLMGDSRPA